jgi:fatty-acyl-CoA synthase
LPYVATSLGVKQVYPGRYVPDVLLALLLREKVTFSHCVPTILQMLLAASAARGSRLDGWKVIIGGAALPQPLARQALDLGADVFVGYGMSETCPVLTLSHLAPDMLAWPVERQVEIRTRTGRPIPLVQLRVVDLELKDVPHDGRTPGEIVVRAPWLTRGYLKDPASSERLWAGGWLHTGDIAVIDERGYVKITDRLKDVIKTGGEWVSSLDLEDLILGHPGVAEVAVIGVPDPRWTERPLAVVVTKPGQQVEAADIRGRLQDLVTRGALPGYAVPERFEFVASLPRTSVGKLNKQALRGQYVR